MKDNTYIEKLHRQLLEYPKGYERVAKKANVSKGRVSQVLTGNSTGPATKVITATVEVLEELRIEQQEFQKRIENLTNENQ